MVTSRGFSLIELMIGLALLAFLIMLAAPFTNTWSDSAKLHEAESLLRQGVGRAKALAQRNEKGVTGSQAAAVLCNDNATLSLYQAATCTGTTVWSAKLPAVVIIKNSETVFGCLAISNRGLPVASNSCNLQSEYTLSIGGKSEKFTIN
ncbi:pilus assembly FimT family protein [Denitrificimonas caeni]|uniref:pilus assembly FimT family protein n=1 Tax=Denitrificimonas caeni TaxID=521720 RepID=UPI0022B66A45|nr:prepilin-type N-terminal cleavage/methylation domain-containing protein [Denitrificimonas caeni]